MKAYARSAGVLYIAVGLLAGCARHASSLDLDVEQIEESPPQEVSRRARARAPGPERLPSRCTGTEIPAAREIEAEDGWDRSTLRVETDVGGSGRPARVPRVRAAKAVVTGSLDTALFRRKLREQRAKMQACYATALQHQPGLSFRLVILLSVDAEGVVSASLEWETEAQTEVVRAFDACLGRTLSEIRFPGGPPMKVRFPMVFQPEG